ncbi:SDR family NAD(P)-dependent oxidoreductase [Palleronia sediminis]|uniref:SDR family NAD(P)-dependent oxidoreductase n=1 Tax=Palleronia sediminis TaxID=2547833 RepID=A0A4R5ZXW1_9RHOB|nr:SDR family NAD(P)-dependent oxidoreductase [Palleronia sediminis]TDL76021.1 SDR family NAD(P)-dependent oxidoreductase [Palleronia sediminis]
MRDWTGKTYWIVGASEGLGRAVAHKVSRAGASLVLSARSEDRLADLVAELPGRARAVPCDVSDRESVGKAAEEAGEIDGLIVTVGAYWPLAAQDWDADKVETMCDVNLTGVVRVLGRVVPRMVARDAGHIVLTGSLSGFRGLPRSTGYAASKAGLMALAEGMHADLRRSGVEVQLVNPGFIRTRLTDRNDFRMPQILEPDEAAQRFFDHMNQGGFARNFPLALSAGLRGMANFLPDALYYRIVG